MKKKFILIGHKKKHGKDTFAKMLKEHLGNAEILSFADPMRAIMAQMKGMSVEEYKETYNANEDWRDELKTFGNGEILNYTSELFWRDVLLRRANKLDCEYIIVPDFRFLREQIEGATYVKIQNDRVDSNDEHQSETELDDFEFEHIVMNNKGLKELGIIAKEFANYLEPDEESLSIEDIIQMIFDPNQGIDKAHEAMLNKMESRDVLEVVGDEVRERLFGK